MAMSKQRAASEGVPITRQYNAARLCEIHLGPIDCEQYQLF